MIPTPDTEWLEADGRGGYASGTATGERRRRYHALLVAAGNTPSVRHTLLAGFDAWLETPHGRYPLTAQRYASDVMAPDGARTLRSFALDPWPTWSLRTDDGAEIRHEVFVPRGSSAAVLRWRLLSPGTARLIVRPFLAGRDHHQLQREDATLAMQPAERDGAHVWRLREGVPALWITSNGEYLHEPHWYRDFAYLEERARGYDWQEDLPSPGTFTFELGPTDAVLVAAAGDAALTKLAALDGEHAARKTPDAATLAAALRAKEQHRRASFPSRLERAASAYVVKRGRGKTIVAGYPWFTDWGRDTFIALRGLCLATGQLDDAREIVLEWALHVDEGMLPNRFPDGAGKPEFNSVDAALWFVIAAHELREALKKAGRPLAERDERVIARAIHEIVDGYKKGTRHGIAMTDDGLLKAGERGQQLTWMDAKIGTDEVVTPRIGKPVEIQALWLNALRIAALADEGLRPHFERGLASFRARFWNPATGCLFDVVDVEHEAGRNDPSLRPNQILAVGGLPFALLDGSRARAIVDVVERELWTPLGLRTLARNEPFYAGRYDGGVEERDRAYHQGTAWPWLLGPFVEAWLACGAGTQDQARARFVQPLLAHLDKAGLDHVSEIADGDAPHAPRGCPFQAWSLGELLRLDRSVLQSKQEPRATAKTK